MFEDLLRVKRAYEPFLEKIHSREEFLTNEEIAGVLDEFNTEANKKLNNYDKLIPSGTMTLTYKVLKRKKISSPSKFSLMRASCALLENF